MQVVLPSNPKFLQKDFNLQKGKKSKQKKSKADPKSFSPFKKKKKKFVIRNMKIFIWYSTIFKQEC